MAQMKDVKINGVEGRGYLEVTSPPPPRSRKRSRGVAVFDTREKIDAMNKAFNEGRGRYEGVVYRDGEAKTETISVLIKNVEADQRAGTARVTFQLG